MVRSCDKAGADGVPRKTHCNMIALTNRFDRGKGQNKALLIFLGF